MGNGSSVENQAHPSIPGHEDAEVEYEWKGVPHLKGSRSRTYWFDKMGNFGGHKARNEATSIMQEIKSNSGINSGSGCCGGCSGSYGNRTNISEIESYMRTNGPSFEQRMAKHGYSIDWEFIERGIGYTKKQSGRRRQKIRRYPHGWVFFYNHTGRNHSDRLKGISGNHQQNNQQNMQVMNPVGNPQPMQMQNMQVMNPVGQPQQPMQMQYYQPQMQQGQMQQGQMMQMMPQHQQQYQAHQMVQQIGLNQNPQMMMVQAHNQAQPQYQGR